MLSKGIQTIKRYQNNESIIRAIVRFLLVNYAQLELLQQDDINEQLLDNQCDDANIYTDHDKLYHQLRYMNLGVKEYVKEHEIKLIPHISLILQWNKALIECTDSFPAAVFQSMSQVIIK
ncbi:Hypothetical_protein [Hexamita inflata]|uniref:Hypothetical_protein n=1 Tax=Hexamita inflata TaxID=28002 RepID=A0AA86ULM7_9EUKA|nr:Hypothetical protein HINF_LOCUS43787 [Hexamita inflata]